MKRGPAGASLEITNPTKFDAQVAVLAENAEQAQRPLGTTSFLKWRKFAVKAGVTLKSTLN